jgi:Cu2+-exporting ATPase
MKAVDRSAARAAGRTVDVGGPALVAERAQPPIPATQPWADGGADVLYVMVDGQVAGAVGLADEVRQESPEAVDALHELGIMLLDPLKRQAGGGAAVEHADVGNGAARAVAGR